MAKDCRGTIRTSVPPGEDEILWHCQVCGQNGVIKKLEQHEVESVEAD